MRLLRSAVLYTALALGANAAFADMAAVEALREGDMKKLMFHSDPAPASVKAFTDAEGQELTLEAYKGKYALVNFWATWCAPCRHEMPSLDRLQAELGGERFEVVTIATGRNPRPAIDKFFKQAEIQHLPVLLDPNMALARESGVLGLPVTILLDPEGREIARLIGDAEWDSDSAKAIIAALAETDGS
ncbi:TlpA disulfide reductase family protein [Pseudoruegeria sp. SHC-113]|uniref:TlpA disulfide reductase family protein n=1 Tax=Pseudoruegeria sp. SHC-113 TaxID=2855439 RepID=UPI0021BAE88A|nr:TlpA disulfide reductase family protein [Pseudoruegeria sp. SHC-113]MCT8158952.1 TlpA family protein disulfide reductase [Pseudoruegeria sp. SHC-113]